MKIAYITREYPIWLQGGGIGTYMYNISKAMSNLGHEIHVFCEGEMNKQFQFENINVYTITNNNNNFRNNVKNVFDVVYEKIKFDIIECAEYNADALRINEKYPDIPLIVKLHSPRFLVALFDNYIYNYKIFNFSFKGCLNILRRKNIENRFFKYNYIEDEEYILSKNARIIISPSKELAKFISKKWKFTNIKIIPNIYIPSNNFLEQNIPICFKTFIFIGKLMVLKGILDICKALPIIIKKHSDVKFIFVGQALDSPKEGVLMDDFMKFELKDYINNILFTGKVQLNEIPELLNKSDALIIPSLWENFPTVCLEAMSAGKLIIGSKVGGIPEIIGNNCGLMFKSKSHKDLASKIIYAIENPSKMEILARNGRQKVLDLYSEKVIGNEMCKIYESCVK